MSDYIAALIGAKCADLRLKSLVNGRFNYLVAEAIMCYGLMDPQYNIAAKSFSERYSYDNWKFYNNPGANRPLKRNNFMKDNLQFPHCTREEKFSSIYLQRNVAILLQGVLY